MSVFLTLDDLENFKKSYLYFQGVKLVGTWRFQQVVILEKNTEFLNVDYYGENVPSLNVHICAFVWDLINHSKSAKVLCSPTPVKQAVYSIAHWKSIEWWKAQNVSTWKPRYFWEWKGSFPTLKSPPEKAAFHQVWGLGAIHSTCSVPPCPKHSLISEESQLLSKAPVIKYIKEINACSRRSVCNRYLRENVDQER